MNNLKTLFAVILFASLANAVEMGIPVQLKFKDNTGAYPSDATANFTVQILSPTGGCVLREEDFTGVNVVSGSVSLALGSGNRAGFDPNIGSLTAVYDNSTVKNSLTCVDASNAPVGGPQAYNPAATDTRVLRVRATINGVLSVADFIQRATPYAIHAESVGGKVASDILVQNSGTALNQSNLETLLSNATRFNKLQNIAVSGLADSATTATTAGTATNFSGNLVGDVTGTQSATVVAGIRGVTVAATAPTSGQVLGYNGSQYVPMTFVASAPVASVNGQTGAVVLTAANISGVVTSASVLSGDVTGNVSATVVSTVGGKTAAAVASAVNIVNAATALPTNNTLALRDSTGNLVAAGLMATGASVQNVFVYNGANTDRVQIRAPNTFTDYTLVLPTTDGNSGEVLQTDGSGNLTWAAGTSVTSSSIITALGYTPADDVIVVKRSNNLSDLVSATVARTNLGLGGAATLNVGTAVGTVAAGDDSRIAGALQQSAFNTYVASASCGAGQSMYWNSVSSTFLCQNVSLSGDATGNVSTVTVTKVQGTGVSFSSIANGHILQYNGSNIINRAIPTCSAGEYLTFNGTAWSCVVDAGSAGSLASLNVTAPISSTGGSNPTLSMAAATGSVNGYLTSADWTTFNNKLTSSTASIVAVLGYTPANSSSVVLKANNLSDLASATVARTNLGLGALAVLGSVDLSTAQATGTLAVARLPAFSGDATSTVGTASLTLASVGAGVTSGSQYTKVTVDGKGRVTSGAQLSSSDVTTALGYSPASATALGNYVSQTGFNAYVASASCGAGQSMYWNSVSSTFLCQNVALSGDATGNVSTVTVTKLQGTGVSFSSIANGHILQFNGTNIVNRAIPTCGANQYLTFNGTAWSCATDVAAAGIVSAVSVTAPLQTTGGNAPTLSMPVATNSANGYLSSADWTTFNSKITSSAASIAAVLGYAPVSMTTLSNYPLKANNLSDLSNVATARTNLGLGTFATANTVDLGSASATGTLATARLPAMAGDVTSTAGSNSLTVAKIRGVNVNAAAPDVGDALVYNGTDWIPTPAPRSTRVTTNVSVNGTTYTDAMSFPVTSGKTYKFKFNILYATSSTTRGLRLRINHPGATAYSVLYSVPGSTTVGTSYIAAASYDASGDTFTASSATPSGIQFAQAEGIIVASADGTVQLAAAQSSTGTLTIYAGSVVEFREIP